MFDKPANSEAVLFDVRKSLLLIFPPVRFWGTVFFDLSAFNLHNKERTPTLYQYRCPLVAQAAGLGTIGRHSLLITPEFGSMVWLGAVLCEQEFEPDEIKESICRNCNLCVGVCPVNALENPEVNQSSCWEAAFGEDEEKRVWRISCHQCRDICPYNLGSQNSALRKKD